MPRYETRSSQFGLVSGIRQPQSDMVLVAEPAGLFAPEARKGQLYIVAETDQDVSRGRDACQLVIRTIRTVFYEDSSYSVTSSLRKAIVAANRALYQRNFDVLAARRAFVGLTCAVVKGNDLYLAQVAPAQAYVLAEGRLRALPTNLSWNPAQSSSASFLKPGALGSSLSVEPEFYRAVLRPGDALLLCTSNLARLLGRDEVLRLLRGPQPDDIVDELLAICKRNGLPEAHGVAAGMYAALSPAAQATPLSRAGVTERVALGWRGVGDWLTRLTAEAALLFKGPSARAKAQKSALRRDQARREEEQLGKLPEEPPYLPDPLPVPPPLELGEDLEERLRQERRARRAAPAEPLPPSAFLGEGGPPPPAAEQRIDLSDTPSMAALGRHANRRGAPTGGRQQEPGGPPLSERLARPFSRIGGAFSSAVWRRRRRRPPPQAIPQTRREPGLSYRRQRPPFPWQLLLMLVLLVTLLIVYGLNLSRRNAEQHVDELLAQAERAVVAVREAPDETSAQARLDVAAGMLAEVRATGQVTETQESRRRYDELQLEFERAQAAIHKVSYFDDLAIFATHPLPGGLFSSVVIPPPPSGITETTAFESIYTLDANAGVLYRMPRKGGAVEPLLRPDDTLGAVQVGKVRGQAWRFDNIVAVAQSGESGPYTFYFRNGESWSYSIMAGSEEWGRASERFRIANYEGNLYIWGAVRGQLLKYFSGRYGEFPVPWIQNDGGQRPDDALDLAIDGKVYLLRPNGHILVFSSGELEREIAPQGVTPTLVTVTSFFVSGDSESGSIFLVDSYNERIVQIDKQTGALVQQIRARPDGDIRLDQLTSVYVDQGAGRPVVYLINGGQIWRGSLPDQPRPFRSNATPQPAGTSTAAPAETATAAPAETAP